MKKAIYVEQQLVITLWFLGTPAKYRTVSHLFSVARSTVCEIVKNTCKVITENLMSIIIKFLSCSQLQQAAD